MKLLVTDLDNTLYDWVEFYAHAFNAMVERLSIRLDIAVDDLLAEFKTVHERYENSEQPFAVLELPSVAARYPSLTRSEIAHELDDVLHAFNSARSRHLRLYEGVDGTLRGLAERGVTIVGHTEAIVENAYYRLRSLGVSDVFRRLYALEGRGVEHPDATRVASLAPPSEFVRVVPESERKPNPRLLLDICNREDAARGLLVRRR